ASRAACRNSAGGRILRRTGSYLSQSLTGLVNSGALRRLVVLPAGLGGRLSWVAGGPVQRMLRVVIVLLGYHHVVGRVLDVLLVFGDLGLLFVVAHVVRSVIPHDRRVSLPRVLHAPSACRESFSPGSGSPCPVR